MVMVLLGCDEALTFGAWLVVWETVVGQVRAQSITWTSKRDTITAELGGHPL